MTQLVDWADIFYPSEEILFHKSRIYTLSENENAVRIYNSENLRLLGYLFFDPVSSEKKAFYFSSHLLTADEKYVYISINGRHYRYNPENGTISAFAEGGIGLGVYGGYYYLLADKFLIEIDPDDGSDKRIIPVPEPFGEISSGGCTKDGVIYFVRGKLCYLWKSGASSYTVKERIAGIDTDGNYYYIYNDFGIWVNDPNTDEWIAVRLIIGISDIKVDGDKLGVLADGRINILDAVSLGDVSLITDGSRISTFDISGDLVYYINGVGDLVVTDIYGREIIRRKHKKAHYQKRIGVNGQYICSFGDYIMIWNRNNLTLSKFMNIKDIDGGNRKNIIAVDDFVILNSYSVSPLKILRMGTEIAGRLSRGFWQSIEMLWADERTRKIYAVLTNIMLEMDWESGKLKEIDIPYPTYLKHFYIDDESLITISEDSTVYVIDRYNPSNRRKIKPEPTFEPISVISDDNFIYFLSGKDYSTYYYGKNTLEMEGCFQPPDNSGRKFNYQYIADDGYYYIFGRNGSFAVYYPEKDTAPIGVFHPNNEVVDCTVYDGYAYLMTSSGLIKILKLPEFDLEAYIIMGEEFGTGIFRRNGDLFDIGNFVLTDDSTKIARKNLRGTADRPINVRIKEAYGCTAVYFTQ